MKTLTPPVYCILVFAFYFAQNPLHSQTEDPRFYLDENGVTIKCENCQPGDTGTVKGITYEAVDYELLIQRRNEGADLSKVCTSPVLDMSALFFGKSGFNQDIGSWDVSQVHEMNYMFKSAANFNQDISAWDVSNVTKMNEMFNNASSFNRDISGWNVINITEEPIDFATNCPLLPAYYPKWTTAPLNLDQIRTNLIENPPNGGNPQIRKQSILALDNYLIDEYSVCSNARIRDYYCAMMEKVKTELRDEVTSGAKIWMMYNMGYIVKTPEIVFAFDLTPGCSGWQKQISLSRLLPNEILDQIKILFISHSHADHYNSYVTNRVINNGGYVVVPMENLLIGNLGMSTNESRIIRDLKVKSYYGDHTVPVRIYKIICPGGISILHTGDTGSTTYLPELGNLEVLLPAIHLVNAGITRKLSNMPTCIDKTNAKIIIPGHIHELDHRYGIRYKTVYEIPDEETMKRLKLLTWGELVKINDNGYLTSDNENLIKNEKAFRVYPKPATDQLTIEFDKPGPWSIELISSAGQVVHKKEVDGNRHKVDFSAWAKGLYFIRIRSEEFVWTQKLIKR